MNTDEDTCDRCGPSARAFVWVIIGDHYLSFCGHHGTLYWDRLVEVGDVVDMRHMIGAV